MREYFKFYRNFYESIETLGEKSQLLLYKSVMKLYFNRAKNVTELEQICSEIESKLNQKRNVYGTFLAIKPLIMKSVKAYLQNNSKPIEEEEKNELTPGGLINNKKINNKERIINNTEKEIYKEKKIDIVCSIDFEKVFNLYKKNCSNLIPINYERRNKKTLEILRDFLEEIEYDYEYVEKLCIKANDLEKIADNKIDFKSMINNHIGIMNDKYRKNTFKKGVSADTVKDFFAKKKGLKNE